MSRRVIYEPCWEGYRLFTSLMDNDVLHKATSYGLLQDIINDALARDEKYGVLGAAKHVVRKKLKKRPPSRGFDVALEDFNAIFSHLSELEPTSVEIALAACLEYEAQCLNLELDTGESMLCAVQLTRQLNHILTGDKRAIAAIEELISTKKISGEIASKLICLEQVFQWLLLSHGADYIRAAVCSERDVDRAISNCFSCSSPEISAESSAHGLKSYIISLRQTAPTALAPDS